MLVAGRWTHVEVEAGRAYLGILAQVASILDIDDVHVSEYLDAIDDLCERRDALEVEIPTLRRELQRLTTRNDHARRDLKEVAHLHDSLRTMAGEREITENSGMFTHWARDYGDKERQYDADIRACDAILNRQAFDESLEHHMLVALAQECADLEAENDELATRLADDKAFPTDVQHARAALAQAEAELRMLERSPPKKGR
ncbi:Aste57867_11314 [Aphanomyces stellatus]|uniref:Aste57867_11314 protein n=1 Tax=Aphanomyces stellatus TaxID=120398 RepID=A0A485KT04_9STRA|nr:hypothetical protein As57867_011272 [Aphanomyces stellatus]VFT88176.1 Aste57867_11314 [Aphanomyces stellatus]